MSDAPALNLHGRTETVLPDSPRAWYILALLTTAYALSYIDRQLLNLLVDPVKHSLSLSDVQISFLQGWAFVAAYCVASPIIGRLVDITSRRNVLLLCVAGWSLFTTLCGFTNNFWEFALCRAGVGVTEACIFPVAWSLIPDLFSQKRGARAYSIFALGSNGGSAFSLLIGGAVVAMAGALALNIPFLANYETWQRAFIVIGLPGLLFCAVLLTVKEPQRAEKSVEAQKEAPLTLGQSLAEIFVKRWRFYLPVMLGNGALTIVALGLPAWFPAFLSRVYGVSPAAIGRDLGLTSLVCTSAGVLLAPIVSRWLVSKGYRDAGLRVAAFVSIPMAAIALVLPLAPNVTVAIAAAGAILFFALMASPVLGYSCQQASPGRVRGLAAALYSLAAQTIGYGLGPLLIAAVTDGVFHDPKMVGHSLQIVCTICSIIFGLLMFASWKPFRSMLVEQDEGAP